MDLSLAICDDEEAERDYLRQLAGQWARDRGVNLRLSLYPSAEALLFAHEEQPLDVALLDIQMGAMDGVALARRLRREGDRLQIVFITGLPDFMAEGFEVSALHYLLKPVSGDKLAEVLDRAVKRLGEEETTVLLPLKDGLRRLPVFAIRHVEVFSHDLTLHTAEGDISVKMPLGELEAMLGGGFFRCHRSYLANMRHVRKVTKNSLEMDNGDLLPLSRKAAAAALEAFVKTH